MFAAITDSGGACGRALIAQPGCANAVDTGWLYDAACYHPAPNSGHMAAVMDVYSSLNVRAQAILRAETIRPVSWEDGSLRLLDQRALPDRHIFLDYQDAAALAQAIKDMVVRGAPAIGVAAAYGVVLAASKAYADAGDGWQHAMDADLELLLAARPTAVNLHWAVARMRRRIAALEPGDPVPAVLEEAINIHEEDIQSCRRIGARGAALIVPGSTVITHCNAGALATGGYGTALGVIRTAHAEGRIVQVFVDETRPWLQGARLTAWELLQEHISATLLADCAAAFRMQQGDVQWAIVGADRIAANGDVANKIGTYGLALAARAHGVKFMVAAPVSTFDPEMTDGTAIPIEMRTGNELLQIAGVRIAAEVKTWNPVFDITPAHLIDVIVTERGVIHAPDASKIAALLGRENPVVR